MKKYTVLSNLKHNGTLYERGDEIELDSETAESLLKDKIISGDKIPVVVEKDWKRGPSDPDRGPDAEVTGPDATFPVDEPEEETKVGEEEEPQAPVDDSASIEDDVDKDL